MAASGETDLDTLIKSMKPVLEPGVYVFAKIPHGATASAQDVLGAMSGLDVKMLFREKEAWTAIILQSQAATARVETIFPCRQITLDIHSSLDAVGFLAAITTRLAGLGVGVNPISAYYHDHLFVPDGTENVVMEELTAMAAEKK